MDNTDKIISRLLRSGYAAMAPDEALRAPARALIGVSAVAEAALATIDIHSIFDLAASRVFAAAAGLVAIEQDPTAAEARLNVVASDVAQMPPGVPVRELARQPLSILRAIGGIAVPQLATAFAVETMWDLALWPPYLAAKAILSAAFFPEQTQGFDPEAPADLLPKTGVYPTERVFFKKLVIDAVNESVDGAQPIEQAQPIDLSSVLASPIGFSRLATGALLTFSQSWFSLGLTLGSLLHSISLAPGESTRMMMLDWTRRSRAAASEDISETELLSNTMTHSRAVSEVTSATAREFQSGKSTMSSTSTTSQSGYALGFEVGPIAFGGSDASATTTTEVMSASSSFGARDLAANYSQDINDRSQQNASSVRNRRASAVREVSQSESDSTSTRVLTNYNHMHALSIHYYEVVQAFRTTTQLERAERCLFVPVKLVDFSDPALVDRWRLTLAAAALTERARRQLTVEYGVVEIVPQTPRITPGKVVVRGSQALLGSLEVSPGTASRAFWAGSVFSTSNAAANVSMSSPPSETASPLSPPDSTPPPAAPPAPNTSSNVGPDYQRAPVNAPAALLALKGWNIEQLNRIGWTTGRLLMQAGSDSVFVSDDALVVGFSLRDAQAARFVVRLHNGQEITPAAATETAFSFAAPTAITEIESIAVQFTSQQDFHTWLVLQLNLSGTVMPLDVPIVLKPMSVPREVVKFGSVMAARELLAHLDANRLHYTQAILRSLEAATVAALIARFTYRGLPLGQLVDTQPIAVMANFLVFKMNVATRGQADDARWSEEQTAWKNWLALRGLDHSAPKSEIIPLPSGGVFAEAVLGRYNAAEKLDLTRFWNWQDSPIPITAPEIAAVQSGSRAQAEDLKPGQLSAPGLGIQAPTALPDAVGITAIINAVQNGNMFRDMSGLLQSAAVAQAALQASARGATAAGEQAAQTLSTVMANNTERMRIAAAVATGGGSGIGGGGGPGSRPAKNITEEGARINQARDMDDRGVGGVGATSRGPEGSGGTSGEMDSGQMMEGPPSTESRVFDRMTSGPAADAFEKALANAGIDAQLAKGTSTGVPVGSKVLSKGVMNWAISLEKRNGQARAAVIQINFSPNAAYRGKTITFVQTVNDSVEPGPRIDVLTFGRTPDPDDDIDEFDPFYGTTWDNQNRSWAPEGAMNPRLLPPSGYSNKPGGTKDPIAYLYDEPVVYPGQTKMYETVAVVPETTETLGAITWGVKGRGDDTQVLVPDPGKDVSDQRTAGFAVHLDEFYTQPQTVGPDSQRKERYDAILDGFPANDAILTADQKKKIDPIVAKIGNMNDLQVFVSVAGFADATETDPNGISEARARAVESYLVTKGVPKANVIIAGFFGAAWARYPPSATETRNRRVQVRVHYGHVPSP